MLGALKTLDVSVESDLEAKTVEVVGNGGPFEVRFFLFFVFLSCFGCSRVAPVQTGAGYWCRLQGA